MINVEAQAKILIDEVVANITWSPGWPQTFQGITAAQGIGSFKCRDNSSAANTSTRRETHARISIEIQTWAVTPEIRNTYDAAVNTAFGPVLRRASSGHMEEKLAGEITAYRSIMIYEGLVDTSTLQVF